MPHHDSSAKLSIVELAMARTSGQQAKPDVPSPTAGEAGRLLEQNPHDKTSLHRLNSIQAGLDTIKPSVQERSPRGEPALAAGVRAHSDYVPRIASHLVAAAAGAVLMWSVTGGSVRTPGPTPPKTAAAAATIVPAAVPVDTQVRDRLEQWRQSWSNRDADAYLGFYSAQFIPANGAERSVWAEGRRKNFLGKSSISVRIDDVKVVPENNNQAKVTLLQDYTSDSYKETRQPKTFLLSREGGDWQIIGEWEGIR